MLNNYNSLHLSSNQRCSSPQITFVFLTWTGPRPSYAKGPRTGCSAPGEVSQEWRGGITSLNLLIPLILMQSRNVFGFLGYKCTSPGHIALLSNQQAPQSNFLGVALNSLHSPYFCLGLLQPMCRTLHVALDFMMFMQVHCSTLCNQLWIVSPSFTWCHQTCWGHTLSHCSCHDKDVKIFPVPILSLNSTVFSLRLFDSELHGIGTISSCLNRWLENKSSLNSPQS